MRGLSQRYGKRHYSGCQYKNNGPRNVGVSEVYVEEIE